MDENKNDNNNCFLPPKTSNKKTLVLDLDETLVHSQFLEFSSPSDIIIKIEIEKEIYDIHVLVRPGVKEFLEKMEKYYEIVIFTASISKYADILLNIIDPKGLCPFRLFREHCTLINNTFVKDLKKLGRDLKDIIIVDNSPLSYSFHPQNGLPILSWFEDKNDRELYNIIPLLIFLSDVKDVREYIPKLVVENTISYTEVEKLLKNNDFDFKKIKNNTKNRNSKNINSIKSYKNTINNSSKNTNIMDNQNQEKQTNSKEYNINIQIVQNNINNINNILDEKHNKDLKNKLIKYLSISNNDNSKNQKQTAEKLLKLKQKNIISNIENPNSKISYNKTKENISSNNNNNVKGHKRQKTFNDNLNNVKFSKDKEKNYKKININTKKNMKKLIQKYYKESIKKNSNSVQFKQIQNIINKKRRREKTPNNISNINTISFVNSTHIKLSKITFQKNLLITPSVNKKRNNSNNNRTRLSLFSESSDNNIIKKLCTLSNKSRISNNNTNTQKRNINQMNLQFKTKFKSNNNFNLSSNKFDIMNNSLSIKKHSSNNKIFGKFKILDSMMTPCHRKQKSYNENNFFIKIKKNLIKPSELKTRRLLSKNDFLKSEIQKANKTNQINLHTGIGDFKNKLIKRTYGNFKKINLKNIDFITKKDKKRKIDLKNKKKSTEINSTNINELNLNENMFNLYKTLNRNEKNKNEDTFVFNNTSDNFLNDRTTFRKINHQKTISYNLNSTRNLNNLMISKKKLQTKYRINYISKNRTVKRQSQKDFNSMNDGLKRYKKEKDDGSLDMKNMFKNKFFDYSYFINNVNSKNENKSKNRGIKTATKKIHNNK